MKYFLRVRLSAGTDGPGMTRRSYNRSLFEIIDFVPQIGDDKYLMGRFEICDILIEERSFLFFNKFRKVDSFIFDAQVFDIVDALTTEIKNRVLVIERDEKIKKILK